MTSRERFEAWARDKHKHLFAPIVTYRNYDGSYSEADLYRDWVLWQAAERDMLERCVYEAEQGFRRALDGNEIADKLKELLNEQH